MQNVRITVYLFAPLPRTLLCAESTLEANPKRRKKLIERF